jgi:hypothetical protein
VTDVLAAAPFPAAHDLSLAISRCPIMEAHLEGRGGGQECRNVVLHQWAKVPSEEARKRRWRREHHAPIPWTGHLEKAPILFLSSNPNLSPRDLRKPEEVEIADPEPRDELLGKTIDAHPSLWKPFRAPKPYWAADEVVDVHENNFDVWVKADGVTPLSATSRRRPKVPYWEFAREQAEHLLNERPLRPGHHYALTEVVHCKSANEDGVGDALRTCAARYLVAVMAASPARVLVLAGAQAAGAFELIFGLPRQVAGHGRGACTNRGDRQVAPLPPESRLAPPEPAQGRGAHVTARSFGRAARPAARGREVTTTSSPCSSRSRGTCSTSPCGPFSRRTLRTRLRPPTS